MCIVKPSWKHLSDNAVNYIQDIITEGKHPTVTYPGLKNVFVDLNLVKLMDEDPFLAIYDQEHRCFTLFDPGEDLIAILSKDHCMYKEDFAKLMQANGLAPTEDNFTLLWEFFSYDSNPHIGENLPEAVKEAIEIAKEVIGDIA